MKHLICYSCLGLALLLAGSQAAYAQQQGFGLLETAAEAGIKAKASAWLKEAVKNDPAVMKQFDELWSQKNRTITNRLGETFALGNADAAKLLATVRNPQEIPSVKVPAVLTNADLSDFFRANLGLAYARLLTDRRAYDEGLDVLKLFKAEQTAEPSAYLFHRAVCEHKLLLKPETTKTINRLLTDALDAPERYVTVSFLMYADMNTWKDKDLGAVARKMKHIEERLELAKAGEKTQKLQKEVVLRLDELIKEAENKAKKKDGPPGPPMPGDQPMPGDGQGPPDDCPPGGEPGDQPGDPNGNESKKPAQDSKLPSGSAKGDVDQAEVKNLAESWFTLPPQEKARRVAALTQGMSPSHRQAIENYFRNIALDQDRALAPRRK